MTQSTIEKLYAIISILGEDKVEALYQLTGSEKISIAAARKLIKKEKIQKSLTKEPASPSLAKELGVSLSSIYRQARK